MVGPNGRWLDWPNSESSDDVDIAGFRGNDLGVVDG